MKLISWNVNGIRAISKKGFNDIVYQMNPDILCLQETKAQDHQVQEALKGLKGYSVYSNSAEKKGYSGVAILTKNKPLHIAPDLGIDEHDKEGRVLTIELEDFYLTNVYVPNSGSELLRLDYRQTWDKAFLTYLKQLEKTKPVIVCGDFNVAHTPMDLARPKENYNKSAGFMQEEIDGMNAYISNGFIDTFRFLHPEKKDAYTWWSFRGGARQKNVGWRIDYFLVSECIKNRIKSAGILPEVMGSDHCPVYLEIE